MDVATGQPARTPQPADEDEARSVGAVTDLLQRWTAGEAHALDRLVPLVYDELRRLARRLLRHERDDHTLVPSALVHEAFLRLNGAGMTFESRAQFYGLLSQLMRHVLVDHARARSAQKRNGDGAISLDDVPDALLATPAANGAATLDLLALDRALQRLESLDPQQGHVVELRFFGGLSVDETAAALGISPATVKREWASARAWLMRELAEPASPPAPSRP